MFTHHSRTTLTTLLLCAAVLSGPACAKPPAAARLTIWHWMTDRDEAFQALARRYTQETGLPVRFELYAPSELYSQKIRGAAQTDTLPDIFGVLGESRDFASLVKAGFIAELTPAMEAQDAAWRSRFFPKALEMNSFTAGNASGVAPGIYGVPIDVTTIQLVYNKRLFERAGLDADRFPRTWEAWLEAGRRLKAAGITGFVSGWGETWLLDCFASNYAWNLMGREKVLATLRGEVPYTDPDWIRVLALFKELRDAGFLYDGLVTMVNKRAEQVFANEGAAVAFNGSWCVNVYHGMNPSLEYGVALPPQLSDEHPMVIWGGAGSSFMVNARTPRRAEAIHFLQWLTDLPQQRFLVEATRNLPSTRAAAETIPPALVPFATAVDRAVHPSLLPVQEAPAVVEAWGKGIQSILTGEQTPEQVARAVQEVKERELARQRGLARQPRS